MTGNLLAPAGARGAGEHVDALLTARGVRLERIVSHGDVSPTGFWYDQEEAEWVALLVGGARLQIEGEASERALGPGDVVYLPARCRHRVTWTDPAAPTIWLALFVDPSLAPAVGGPNLSASRTTP
ncbi:MAG: cupin domain-containing protein [Alphaproteobacteria bacterium]